MSSKKGPGESQHKRPAADQLSSDEESDASEEEVVSNKFANDGSFLEMFKKMQQQQQQQHKEKEKTPTSNSTSSTDSNGSNKSTEPTKSVEVKRKPKVLKVGVIKKPRPDETAQEETAGEETAWNRYMKEVRMYKEKYGDDEDKNRPLVK